MDTQSTEVFYDEYTRLFEAEEISKEEYLALLGVLETNDESLKNIIDTAIFVNSK
jgi:uridine kinase